jgi:EAL domain-containing protein (putative c-di-GMP-specific phosphodiesterase class I)
VRIRQPDGGVLRAGAFMPEIERLGLAPLVDRQVLTQTFAVLARHPNARFSINVFPQTMQDRQWMTLFDQAAARDPTLPERLIVEITETGSMLEPARTREFMEHLRGHGVSFALDDFGAGHTALHYLRDFRFDILKIDGRFVRDIELGSDNAFLVERMIEIARRFEMMTVAEAVQSQAEARCLAELGVEHFQGFHFGSPSLMLEPTATPMPSIAAQA